MASSDSDTDSEDEARLAALAACAVDGQSIAASAQKSAETASKAFHSQHHRGDNSRSQDGAYVAATDNTPGEERPLEGLMAEKVTEQLHRILERTFHFSSADETEQHVAAENAAAVSSDREHTEAIRLFSCVKEGTAVVLDRPPDAVHACNRTSWTGKLKAMGATRAVAAPTHKATRNQARSMAVDALDIIQRAQESAAAASMHVVAVVAEVDSDTEAWRGGVKPGSSIQQSLKHKKAKKRQAANSDGVAVPSSEGKKKRKGKKERSKEKSAKTGDGSIDPDVAGTADPAKTGQAATDGDASAKLARKRAKRREIKKRRRGATKG